MTARLLLDTCALIWISQADHISEPARIALDATWVDGHAPQVSPISAWEIGMLVAKGRLALTMTPERWWDSVVDRVGLEMAPLPPATLMASTHLPGTPPADPTDRIIAATAREQDLRLMTRDAKLLAYALAGHLNAIAC